MDTRERLEILRTNSVRRAIVMAIPSITAGVLLFAWAQPVVFPRGWHPPAIFVSLAPQLSFLAINIWQLGYVVLLVLVVYWPIAEVKRAFSIADRLEQARRRAEDDDLRNSFRRQ